MRFASIIIRPQVNLPAVREACKTLLDVDLTTQTKGILEPLAVYSKLIDDDEYLYSELSEAQLHFTLLIVCDDWVLHTLQNWCKIIRFFSQSSTKDGICVSFVSGYLADFISLIIKHSKKDTDSEIRLLFNIIQSSFESEGYSLLFKDYTKEKLTDGFFLRKK